jgi:hypothetical protein
MGDQHTRNPLSQIVVHVAAIRKRPGREGRARWQPLLNQFGSLSVPNATRDIEPETLGGEKVSRCAQRQRERVSRGAGQCVRDALPLAHAKRPPCMQLLVTKARTHAAKRERPGREARAFTLNLLARQFRARLLK